jgi:L-fucose isomerase-like protein
MVAGLLGDEFHVLLSDSLSNIEESVAAVAKVNGLGLEVVLILSSMAVPPQTLTTFLNSLEAKPEVVIWAVNDVDFAVRDDFNHGAITQHGSTVGAPMIASALLRSGTRSPVILGRLGDDAVLGRIRSAIKLGGASARLRRARIGAIGTPLVGYSHVVTDSDQLQKATGMTVVDIEPSHFADVFRAVNSERAGQFLDEMTARYCPSSEIRGSQSLLGAARAAVALQDLCEALDLSGGAMNCHVDEIRLGEEIGFAPCFALGHMTSRGVPWTCVGDVLTAIAMVGVAALGRPTLYHEIEAIDYESGELLIANSGEHDSRFWPSNRPSIERNDWFPASENMCSVCVTGELADGLATLVAFAEQPDHRYRFITAQGRLTGRGFPWTGTTNGGLRLDAEDPFGSWEVWAEAGPGHHSCLTTGHVAADLGAVASAVGCEWVSVC